MLRVLILLLAVLIVGAARPDARAQQQPEERWKKLQCTGMTVTGRYVNYAEGFSVAIPRGLTGRRGQAAGPERGVSIPLSSDCERVVVVYGFPNSLEWRTPEEAIAGQVALARADSLQEITRYQAVLAGVRVPGVSLQLGAGEVEDFVVHLHQGRGRLYWAHLVSTKTHYTRDREQFLGMLATFRFEPWR